MVTLCVGCLSMASPGREVEGSRWTTAVWSIIAFWIITFVAGLLATPPYSHAEHALSTLGLADFPFGLIARLAFVVLGLGVLLLATYFRRLAAPLAGTGQVVVILLVIHGVGRLGEGVFPPVGDGPVRILHLLFGVPAVLAMAILPFTLWAWARRSGRAQLARPSLGFGIVFVVLMILGMAAALLPNGLGQRVGFALWYVWLIWVLSPRSLPSAPLQQASGS